MKYSLIFLKKELLEPMLEGLYMEVAK